MTIAAGFIYNEGVLLCADTQYTGQIRAHGTKLLRYNYDDGSRSVIATIGSGRYARMGVQLIQDFIAGLKPAERTLGKMHAILISAVRELHHEHLYKHPLYKTSDLNVQYLMFNTSLCFGPPRIRNLGFMGLKKPLSLGCMDTNVLEVVNCSVTTSCVGGISG